MGAPSDRTDPIGRLIRLLSKLPGIGEKTATRLAFHVLRAPPEYARDLAQALLEVKEKIRLCQICMNLTEQSPCPLCADVRRDPGVVCVVATPPDLFAIERTGGFRGRYHVLHGVLSPLSGVGPDELRIQGLVERVRAGGVEEIILATSPTVEGEATAAYLSRLLKPLGPRVTRIAMGVPVGSDLEWADEVTMSKALEGRREY